MYLEMGGGQHWKILSAQLDTIGSQSIPDDSKPKIAIGASASPASPLYLEIGLAQLNIVATKLRKIKA